MNKHLITNLLTSNEATDINCCILKLKTNILSLKIIQSLRGSALAITKALANFENSIKLRKSQIIENILKQRQQASHKIQSQFKTYRSHKKVKALIARLKDHYCILSQIKNVKSIILQVYPKKGKTQKFEFEYCDIRNTHVLYIPKKLITVQTIRVNFIADGKVYIDPNFRTDYDLGGMFYNIIEFDKLAKLEQEKKEELNGIISYYYFKKKSSDESSSDDEKEDKEGKVKAHHGDLFDHRNNTRLFRNSVCYTSPRFGKLGNFKNSDTSIPKVKTLSNLYMPKPILKNPGSQSNLNKSKKVSFTNILVYDY
jgi:hypothetical protein